MKKKLTCEQVCALINFYIENKLTPKLREEIDIHLANCPACKDKINEYYKILTKYTQNNSSNLYTKNDLNPEFTKNLSAYVDNELNPNENVRIKKITISNPAARKKLDEMYKFQKLLHSSYYKTKVNSKLDYSRQIIAQIQNNEAYSTTYFHKIVIMFAALLFAIIAGFIYLYF